MVVLNKIYTRTGDDGTTALGDGVRVRKDGARVEAYGTVDELNAAVGVARAGLAAAVQSASQHASQGVPQGVTSDPAQTVDGMLARIQNDLFDLGADLCVPDRGQALDYTPLRVHATQVVQLEADIDDLNQTLEPLRSFVLPAGHSAAAALHLARTVCRRAERRMVELAAMTDEPVGEAAIKYVNRLSDFLFVAARFVNHTVPDANGGIAKDVLWVPGQSQTQQEG